MENRDIEHLFEFFFNVEALGRLNVFQIDSAKGGSDCLCDADDFVGIVAVHFDVEDIHIGEFLEKHAFAFHNGLACQCASIPQSKDGRTVCQHGYQVSFGRVFVGGLGILLNFENGNGHSWRVSQTQIALGIHGFGWDNGDFSRFTF